MQNIGIIGYGRFGQVLAKLLIDDFSIHVYDINPVISEIPVKQVSLAEIVQQQTLFVAVPISQFENVIVQIAPQLSAETTLIDLCSVKMHPVEVMLKHLPLNIDIIATHPMFGPDSIAMKNNLRMMMQSVRDNHGQYAQWKKYFSDHTVEVIEMTASEHDKQAAYSQGITHFLGRVLSHMQARSHAIDTVGYRMLLAVMEQTCHDSWQLFCDLQRYNPYSQSMIEQLRNAVNVTAVAINNDER